MSNFTDVYYACLPQVMGRRGIYPQERMDYILNTSNPLLMRQRYYVWLVLEYGLEHSLHKHLPQLQITQNERGQWVSPFCHFSLSHGDNAVAVAVSRQPVGIDVQKRISNEKYAKHILTPIEQNVFDRAEDKLGFLTELWTKKEAIFKAQTELRFQPKRITAQEYCTETRIVTCMGENYALSVTAPIRNFQKVQL